jgi:hypothetical protein
MKTFKILSIDAWAGSEPRSWEWNNWHTVGSWNSIPDNNRAILKKMREDGFLNDKSKGRVAIEDDQYNIVIVDRSNNMPLYAIEYGSQF